MSKYNAVMGMPLVEKSFSLCMKLKERSQRTKSIINDIKQEKQMADNSKVLGTKKITTSNPPMACLN